VEVKSFEISDETMGFWNEEDDKKPPAPPPKKIKINFDKTMSPRKNLKIIEEMVSSEEKQLY
jgi:hypothetical protein